MWLFSLFDLHRISHTHIGSQVLCQSNNGVGLFFGCFFILLLLLLFFTLILSYLSEGHISESLFLQT